MDLQNIVQTVTESLQYMTSNRGSSLALAGVTMALGSAAVWSAWQPGNLPPGPPRIPILGSMDFVGMDEKKFHLLLTELSEKYGDIYTLYTGNSRLVVLNSYEIIKEAFVTKGQQCGGRWFDPRTFGFNPVGQAKGITDPDPSDEWKMQRHTALTIMRTLGWGQTSLESRIQEEAAHLIKLIENKQGQPLVVGPIFHLFVANVICSLLFGQRHDLEDTSFRSLLRSLDEWFLSVSTDTDVEYVPILKYFRPSKWATYKENKERLYRAGAAKREYIQNKIAEAKKKLAKGEEADDFVSLYLTELSKIEKGKTNIKEDWLLNIISDFFVAGSESSSTTLTWSMLYMALNPDVQEKVQRELDKLVGKENYTFSLSDRERIPYVEATVMEFLRKGAIAPIGVPHRTIEDVEIGGYTIPKDTQLIANQYKMLNDPKVWDSPNSFRPERFIGDDGKILKPNNWAPFSMGRRTCLGEQLARQELFLFFSHLMHRFTVSLPEGEPKPSDEAMFVFVLKPHPHKVCLKPRW